MQQQVYQSLLQHQQQLTNGMLKDGEQIQQLGLRHIVPIQQPTSQHQQHYMEYMQKATQQHFIVE